MVRWGPKSAAPGFRGYVCSLNPARLRPPLLAYPGPTRCRSNRSRQLARGHQGIHNRSNRNFFTQLDLRIGVDCAYSNHNCFASNPPGSQQGLLKIGRNRSKPIETLARLLHHSAAACADAFSSRRRGSARLQPIGSNSTDSRRSFLPPQILQGREPVAPVPAAFEGPRERRG